MGNKLNPCEWGWRQLSDGTLVPIPTTLPPSPDELLHLVTCNCKGGYARRCDCKNAGLSCSGMCGRCRGTSCGNTERVGDEQDDDDECEIVSCVTIIARLYFQVYYSVTVVVLNLHLSLKFYDNISSLQNFSSIFHLYSYLSR